MIEKLDALDLRTLRLLVFCVSVLLVAAFVTQVVVPHYKRYAELVDSRDTLLTLLASSSSVSGETMQVQAEVQKLQKQVAGDMASLPEQEMEAHVIDRLQAISWRNEVQLGALKPSQGVDTPQYRELLFQVELHGSYFHLVDWLQDLADELGFVVVRDSQIVLRQTGSLKPELAARLSLAAYRLAGVSP